MSRSVLGLKQTFTCPSSSSSTLLSHQFQQNLSHLNLGPLTTCRFAHQRSHRKHTLTTDASAVTVQSTHKPFNTATDDPINGPESTLPAPLNLPAPRQPDESRFKYLYQLGSAYGKFYKTGVLNAGWHNVKLAAPVLSKFRQDGGMAAAKDMSWLTRSDLQLIQRRNHDIKRIPVFGLVALICGEFTPLAIVVVIALSSIVPYTCRIPRQINKERENLETRRVRAFELHTARNDANTSGRTLENLQPDELVHCSNILGFHSSIWHSIGLSPPPYFIRGRLGRHVQYLEVDDGFLKQNGAIDKLNKLELELACEDRALKILNRTPENLRKALQDWMKQRFGQASITCYDIWLTKSEMII